jgi:hypothetical protein
VFHRTPSSLGTLVYCARKPANITRLSAPT